MMQRDYLIEQATFQIACLDTIEGGDFETAPHHATGVYVAWKGRSFLVTNWHVLTGRNPADGSCLEGYQNRIERIMVKEWITGVVRTVPLYSTDNEPIWIEVAEPTQLEGRNYKVDLAAIPMEIPVNPIPLEFIRNPISERLEPNSQLIVLGYPFLRERGIWKTAHVAESVQPGPYYFLVDGRTKPGMSGSGVFSCSSSNEFGQIFLGVYSGRYNDRSIHETLNDLDLGIVWKLRALDLLFGP